MKKKILQFALILCVMLITYLVLKIITTTDVIYRELFAGLSILVLLTTLRLINNLSETKYGNHEEN
jgi:hypothetical protein